MIAHLPKCQSFLLAKSTSRACSVQPRQQRPSCQALLAQGLFKSSHAPAFIFLHLPFILVKSQRGSFFQWELCSVVRKTIDNSLILKTFNYRLQDIALEPHLTWHCKRTLGHIRGLMLCFRDLLIYTGKRQYFINGTYKS